LEVSTCRGEEIDIKILALGNMMLDKGIRQERAICEKGLQLMGTGASCTQQQIHVRCCSPRLLVFAGKENSLRVVDMMLLYVFSCTQFGWLFF